MSIHVTLRQLRLFLALAERGSVSAAARACHVTQPTVSMQLKEIGEAVVNQSALTLELCRRLRLG